MLSVSEAQKIMLAAVTPLPAERVPLEAAFGSVLAEPVMAARDQPPYPASEMDGYALRSQDTPGRLTVAGESAAGHGFTGICQAGLAIRISTGAAVPEGADAVVIQESVRREGDHIDVPAVLSGSHVRPRALDFAAGTVLQEAGRKLDGIALALAAASGAATLAVARPPRVAILTGGDELAEPGSVPGPFQIYDSGGIGVASLVRGWGGRPERLALEKDDAAAIARAAERGLKNSDLLVVIGGASVGDHDHARPALTRLGLQLAVDKISLRPGKPTWFGVTPLGLVLGLPGNPASALVCAHLFLAPLLRAMQGREAVKPPVRARLVHALPGNGPREHYLRGLVGADDKGQLTAQAFENQDSSMLSPFASANALIRQLPDASSSPEGAMVEVLLLDQA
jgi:molybdopterin molybdotransferase